MCKCTPEIRTPFCGKLGCEWPKQEGARTPTDPRPMHVRRFHINIEWLSPELCLATNDQPTEVVLASDYDTALKELAAAREAVAGMEALIDELIAAQNAVSFAASLDATRKGTTRTMDEACLRHAKAIIALCSYRITALSNTDGTKDKGEG